MVETAVETAVESRLVADAQSSEQLQQQGKRSLSECVRLLESQENEKKREVANERDHFRDPETAVARIGIN